MPPAFTPPPKTVRQHESYPSVDTTDHLTIPSSVKLITHNERTGGKTTTFSEKVTTKASNFSEKTTKTPNSDKGNVPGAEKIPSLTKNSSFEKISSQKNNSAPEKSENTSNSLCEKLPSKSNLENITLEKDEKEKNNKEAGEKCKLQRRYSWKISRPSLRKKSGKSRSGSDSDAILILNNGRDHSQCNGGGVTRHVSMEINLSSLKSFIYFLGTLGFKMYF